MQTVTIHDAKTNLSKYVAAAKSGKKIFIGGFGKPEVKLTPITPADLLDSQQRDFTVAQGMLAEKPESFSEQTEAMVEKLLTNNQDIS